MSLALRFLHCLRLLPRAALECFLDPTERVLPLSPAGGFSTGAWGRFTWCRAPFCLSLLHLTPLSLSGWLLGRTPRRVPSPSEVPVNDASFASVAPLDCALASLSKSSWPHLCSQRFSAMFFRCFFFSVKVSASYFDSDCIEPVELTSY